MDATLTLSTRVVCSALSVGSVPEVSGHLVGSTAFKAAGTGAPRPAGSIPVHLRQLASGLSRGARRT